MVAGWSRWLVLAALTLTGCKNSNYCEGNPNNDCRAALDSGSDGQPACTSSAECAAPTAVCDTSAGACVQCLAPTEISACTGVTPVCDPDHTCRRCEANSECASALCAQDGSCATESEIAYVAATGTGTACTKLDPCPQLGDALAKNLPFVKVATSGAANAASTIVIEGKAVTIVGETGASLDRNGDGPILEVRSANADVSIYDLIVTGATSGSGIGVLLTPNGGTPKLTLTRVTVTNNQGGGIATAAGTLALTVTQSNITNNQGGGISTTGGALTVTQSTIASNQGGGIAVSGGGATFSITNTFIYRNGDQDTGTYGGVNLAIATAGSNVFAFNTVVDNRASTGGTRSGGIICDIAGFTAPNNIVARNAVGGVTTDSNSQTLGVCTYPTSKVQNDATGLNFQSPASAPFSYKLLAGSSAIDQATTASSIAIDHDGDARPLGAAKDIGADEYKP